MIIIYVDRRLVNLLSSTGIPADGWSLVEQVCDIPAKLENNIPERHSSMYKIRVATCDQNVENDSSQHVLRRRRATFCGYVLET